MRILLVSPHLNWPQSWCEAPSTALLILGTLAQTRGHEVKVLHLDTDRVHIADELAVFKPDIVGITVNTFQVKSARQIAQHARAAGAKVIIGGPHAPVWDGEADEVVIGEGENRWLEILGENYPSSGSPLGYEPVSIDDVPIPNYDLVDLDRFCGISPQVGAVPSMCMMASRGCPFECTFCNTPLFWGKKVRYHDPQYVVDEIERLHKKYGAREVFIQDDTFNLNHRWAGEIFEGIIRKGLNREMIFRITGRVNEKLVTKDYLDLAFRAGVWSIFYGIESGSQIMLDRMKKKITVPEIKRAVKMTHDAHIQTTCSFVVGLPGESHQTLKETGELINEINPTRFGWAFACPFPNTEFDKEVRAKGHIRELDYADYTYGGLYCRTDDLSFEELAQFRGF